MRCIDIARIERGIGQQFARGLSVEECANLRMLISYKIWEFDAHPLEQNRLSCFSAMLASYQVERERLEEKEEKNED